jgi:hypothetical protein
MEAALAAAMAIPENVDASSKKVAVIGRAGLR